MALIDLSTAERRSLREIIKHARDAKQVKRAQALLWLDQGEPVDVVASRQEVSCQTIYNWVNSFRERRDEPVAERLQDRPRPGRAPKKRQAVQAVVREVMDKDPHRWG